MARHTRDTRWVPYLKLAMPVSAGRVLTAFDLARHLLVVEYEDGREVSRSDLVLEEELPLICGAISWPHFRQIMTLDRPAGATTFSTLPK